MYNKSKIRMFSKKADEIYEKLNPGLCSACGGHLYFERVSLDYNEDGRIYVIDDVPAFVCESCGEIWIPKPVVEELEKLVKAYSASQKNQADGEKEPLLNG
ncbi:MAG: type II toxin-antitoxin system MqsA family antitoxin [Candidatus Margulisiibacteriota bacterium]